jgi:hypothetical protein
VSAPGQPTFVIAGLVPAIHVPGAEWTTGTSPVVTINKKIRYRPTGSGDFGSNWHHWRIGQRQHSGVLALQI